MGAPAETIGYVGLGANLGDPATTIAKAIVQMARPELTVLRRASLFRTRPVGPIDQPDFINTVVEVRTTLSARALLDHLLEVETALGRVRAERWGPRIIDLDLLLLGRVEQSEPGLVVPHPELARRAFVLVPLAELAPDLTVPGLEQTVGALLLQLSPAPGSVVPLR